jgi:hypothetical protein
MEGLRSREAEVVPEAEEVEKTPSEPVRESAEEKRKRLPTSLPVGGIITPV